MKRWLLVLGTVLTACGSVPSPMERRDQADALARQHGWQAMALSTGVFELVAYLPAVPRRGDRLTVYIEGDGLAWVTPSQPSLDPTPRQPLGLQLALAHPLPGPVAYLARPCQYIDAQASHCAQRYWTERRFAPEVVEASNRALDVLKSRLGAQSLTLVGYSGGGAVAALLAAHRHDVDRLITVAGNLDHQAWTRHHRIGPLTGSLNPADFRKALQEVQQWHFTGSKDQIMPPQIAHGFASGFSAGKSPPRVMVILGYDHQCCWAENWANLLDAATIFDAAP